MCGEGEGGGGRNGKHEKKRVLYGTQLTKNKTHTVDAAGVEVSGTRGRALTGQFCPSVRRQVACEKVRLTFHAVVALILLRVGGGGYRNGTHEN